MAHVFISMEALLYKWTPLGQFEASWLKKDTCTCTCIFRVVLNMLGLIQESIHLFQTTLESSL